MPSKSNGKVKDAWKDIKMTYTTGKVSKEILQGSEPKSYVSMTFGGPDTWSRDAERDARILSMVLDTGADTRFNWLSAAVEAAMALAIVGPWLGWYFARA